MSTTETRPGRSAAALSAPVLLAIVFTLLAWASAFVVIRGIGDSFSPGGIALGRLLVGTAGLAVLLIGRRWVRPTGSDLALIAVYGVLWFGAYNVLLNLAEQTLDAGTTAMVVNTGPLLIAAGAAVFLGEAVHRWLLVGLAVAFVGVLLIGFANGVRGAHLGLGVLAALAAALTYAAGVLVQKRVLGRLPTGEITFLGVAAGLISCLPFAGALITELGTAPASATLGVVYLGVVPTALAFSTWGYALSRMPASQLAITTYIVPPLVIVAALLFFGEFPAPLAVVGGVLCLVGVGLSRHRSRAARTVPGTR
ncbi:DMT family transporter [Amnibacterium flavum]|uniref:EamA family transporter n=1 Tax=Amnibacterium flavum TaxID=2173173 RepID=A0A2V1HU56_9MICO|nr:DMT family transporter [Amnibacterium flavum]PVZ96113.1 EamA family transporter [Amnibacterium flavum]